MNHFQSTLADLEYVMLDSSSIRVHQDAARTHRGQTRDAMGRSRGGLTTSYIWPVMPLVIRFPSSSPVEKEATPRKQLVSYENG